MSAQRQDRADEARANNTNNVTPFPAGASRVVVLDFDNAKLRREVLARFRDELLVHGVDYGTIPHTNGATLYKPGGEKLLDFFGLAYTIEVTRDEDWKGNRLSYEVKTIILDRKTKEVLGKASATVTLKRRNTTRSPLQKSPTRALKWQRREACLTRS